MAEFVQIGQHQWPVLSTVSIGREAVRTLATLAVLPVLLLLAYAIGITAACSSAECPPADVVETCLTPSTAWILFVVVTELVLLHWTQKVNGPYQYSTLVVWASMMTVIGTALSVFSRDCGSGAYERAFIVMAIWMPLICNYGAVLIMVTYIGWHVRRRTRQEPFQRVIVQAVPGASV